MVGRFSLGVQIEVKQFILTHACWTILQYFTSAGTFLYIMFALIHDFPSIRGNENWHYSVWFFLFVSNDADERIKQDLWSLLKLPQIFLVLEVLTLLVINFQRDNLDILLSTHKLRLGE